MYYLHNRIYIFSYIIQNDNSILQIQNDKYSIKLKFSKFVRKTTKCSILTPDMRKQPQTS